MRRSARARQNSTRFERSRGARRKWGVFSRFGATVLMVIASPSGPPRTVAQTVELRTQSLDLSLSLRCRLRPQRLMLTQRYVDAPGGAAHHHGRLVQVLRDHVLK